MFALSFFLWQRSNGILQSLNFAGNMDTVSVAVMLARLEITYNADGPVTFDIIFIKADGSIRKMKAQNHVKHAAISSAPVETTNFKYNLKEKGTVLLYDLDKQEHRAVKIDRIVFFNGLKVQH